MSDPIPLRAPRADLTALADAIKRLLHDQGSHLSLAEAIGVLEVAKYEILKSETS